MSNRRFEMYEVRQVLVRMRQGDSDRALAKAGQTGRRSAAEIRRVAEAKGWLDVEAPLPGNDVLSQAIGIRSSSVVTRHSQSCVEPYREQVKAWADQGVACTTIYQALVRNHQFSGGYSSVYRFVCGLRPPTPPKATIKLDFAPGEVAQVDFGTGPRLVDTRTGKEIKSWFFLMTLAFSRHQYAEIVLNQKTVTWLECHRHAFEFFGGVMGRVMIDNAKCAITKACYHDPVVQRAYAEYAEGYGFKIDALPPRQPQLKGRVESGIKYLKKGFMPTRQFRHLHDANQQLQQWILGQAGNRIHGTTGDQPLTLFAIEKPLFKPLPCIPPVVAAWAKVKVHRDAHIQFETCLYSVPHPLVSQTLWLKAEPYTLRIYQDQQLVVVHARLFIPGSRHTVDDHLPPNALAYKMQQPTWCLTQAQRVGPACHRLVDQLFKDRVLHNLRAVQGILGLEKTYGAKRLNDACQRALDFHNPRYGAVKSILNKGLDQSSHPQQAFDTLADCYTGQGRYSRDTSTMLKH